LAKNMIAQSSTPSDLRTPSRGIKNRITSKR